MKGRWGNHKRNTSEPWITFLLISNPEGLRSYHEQEINGPTSVSLSINSRRAYDSRTKIGDQRQLTEESWNLQSYVAGNRALIIVPQQSSNQELPRKHRNPPITGQLLLFHRFIKRDETRDYWRSVNCLSISFSLLCNLRWISFLFGSDMADRASLVFNSL